MPRVELTKAFRFEAAHYLPKVPEGHRCARMHGHSYRVEVGVAAPVDPELGWVMDFADISGTAAPVLAELDHQLLNDVPGLDNPTSELLATWLGERLVPSIPGLAYVRVSETPTSSCTYFLDE